MVMSNFNNFYVWFVRPKKFLFTKEYSSYKLIELDWNESKIEKSIKHAERMVGFNIHFMSEL